MSDLKTMLIRHEGLELKPYRDSAGKITIGVGRNLDDVGISTQEAMAMLDRDIARAFAAASTFAWYPKLDPVRRDVVANMVFNLGLQGFCEFKLMITAIERGDFEQAAVEMLQSSWATQVHERATELAIMMQTGLYCNPS